MILSTETIINLGGLVAVPLGCLAIAARVMRVLQPDRLRWKLLLAFPIVAMPLVAGAMVWATVIRLDASKPILDRVFQDAGNMALATFSLGLMLFLLRKEERFLYGVAEISFGVVTAAYVGWRPEDGTLARLIALGAATYIVVRGFDNVDIGRKTPGGTPFTRWIGKRKSRNTPELVSIVRPITPTDQTTRATRTGRS